MTHKQKLDYAMDIFLLLALDTSNHMNPHIISPYIHIRIRIRMNAAVPHILENDQAQFLLILHFLHLTNFILESRCFDLSSFFSLLIVDSRKETILKISCVKFTFFFHCICEGFCSILTFNEFHINVNFSLFVSI